MDAPNPLNPPPGLLFLPGMIVGTPAALALLQQYNLHPIRLLARHLSGDWGEISQDDAEANLEAIDQEGRILSCYVMSARERLWIITERDRSVTTLLRPSDYQPAFSSSGDAHVHSMSSL